MTVENVIIALGAVSSSGVLAGGLGLLRWVMATERRLMVLEVEQGIR